MRKGSTVALAMAIAVLSPSAAGAQALSDFEDGTLQGWTLDPISSVNFITVVAAGNPGFAMESFDCCSGLPTIVVNAPSQFTGDLSMFAGIQWDELFLHPDEGSDLRALSVFLHGSNGTSYRSIRSRAGHPPNVWRTTFVAFEATEWTLCTDPNLTCAAGVASFSGVISDVERLSIHHETSSTLEADSRSDNIQLVEGAAIPTLSQWGLITLGMFLLATMFVVTRQRVPIGG